MHGNRQLRTGSLLMAISGIAFIGYGLVFLVLDLLGGGFELGVAAIDGVSKEELTAFEPAIVHYISHLHVATAAFIIATGVAVTGLSWHGVRRGQLWAWTTAVLAPVVGLALALPMHYMDRFGYDWLVHLGPIYLATVVFVIGAVLALQQLVGPSRGSALARAAAHDDVAREAAALQMQSSEGSSSS